MLAQVPSLRFTTEMQIFLVKFALFALQFFTLTKEDEIVFNDDKCLDVPEMAEGAFVQWYSCHGLKGNQEWKHDKKAVKFCLN